MTVLVAINLKGKMILVNFIIGVKFIFYDLITRKEKYIYFLIGRCNLSLIDSRRFSSTNYLKILLYTCVEAANVMIEHKSNKALICDKD